MNSHLPLWHQNSFQRQLIISTWNCCYVICTSEVEISKLRNVPSKLENCQTPVDPQPVAIETILTDIGFGSNHCMKILSFMTLPLPTLMFPKAHDSQNGTVSLQFRMFGVSTWHKVYRLKIFQWNKKPADTAASPALLQTQIDRVSGMNSRKALNT